MSFVPLCRGLSVAATLALAGCASEATGPRPDAPPPAVPITTAAAVSKTMPLEASVVGSVEAYATVAVRAQITGELTGVHLQQGEEVKAGQDLFSLDRRPLEAALQQSTANLERDLAQAANARMILERSEELAKRGVVSREQRDTARTSVATIEATIASDRAALENAKVQLQYATIRAPISGRTGVLMVNAGNLVRANDQTALVTINQVSPIYVTFAFPEALLADVRRYMARGSLAVEAGPAQGDGPTARGRVTFVDNAVDLTTGTIKLKGTFPNDDHSLWPGQFVNVVVRLATQTSAIVVPSVAVQTGPDGSYVYVVKADETVELRPVKVARVAGAESVIQAGVAAGDTVVTDGHLRLIPGSRVKARGAVAPKAGS